MITANNVPEPTPTVAAHHDVTQMKIVALAIVCALCGMIGLLLSMAIGGLSICAISLSRTVVWQAVVCSLIPIVIGAPFGRKLWWWPFACFAFPLTVIAPLVAISIGESARAWAALATVIPAASIVVSVHVVAKFRNRQSA